MSEERSTMERLMEHFYVEDFDSLSVRERWLYAACWFVMETNGNAFQGYFSNQAGGQSRDALRGLELVGARRTADILRRAIAVFPNNDVPIDISERQAALNSLSEGGQRGLLSRLTDELFSETEDVAALVDAYIQRNRPEFPALFREL
jgi:hypothetical protein